MMNTIHELNIQFLTDIDSNGKEFHWDGFIYVIPAGMVVSCNM